MTRRDLLFGACAALPKLLAAGPVPLKPGELDLLYGTAPFIVEGPPQWVEPPNLSASVEYFMETVGEGKPAAMYRIRVDGSGGPNTAMVAQVPLRGALYLMSIAPDFPLVLGPWPVPDEPCSVRLSLILGVAGSDTIHFGGDPPPGIVLSIFPVPPSVGVLS